jgi:hypothetical protein
MAIRRPDALKGTRTSGQTDKRKRVCKYAHPWDHSSYPILNANKDWPALEEAIDLKIGEMLVVRT